MKKLLVLAIICCAMLFTSCHRPQEFYNATISEYHFASGDNETSVKAVLGTVYTLWEGDYAYKGLTADLSDVKAIARYQESLLAILSHANELEPYFEDNDYIVYTLKRITDGEVVLLQDKIYVDEDGRLKSDNITDNSFAE